MLSQIARFAVETAFPDTSKFYVDDDDDYEEEEEVLFCKNNVCVHPSKGKDSKTAGYLTIKSRTRKSGHVRLIVTWTPNSNLATGQQPALISDATKSKLLISDPAKYDSLEYFSVDLSEMKVLKLFYNEEDPTSGQFVIGNYENHYKVFNFHYGGLNRVTQILEDWCWCVGQRRSQDEVRKRCFVVVSRNPVLEDCYAEEGRYDPMSIDTWKTFVNTAGQIEDVANFRRAVFFGGLSPEVRKEAWKFLLSYYSFSSTFDERATMRKEKEKIYHAAHNARLSMSDEEYVQFWKVVQCTVDKDVPRTDRSHPYYAGEGNPNTEVMRSILLNYAVHNPNVGYSQGMSDLLSPVLAVVQDEVDAFWCFVGLMEASVFVTSPKDDVMDKQLAYLRELVRMLEPKFYAHMLIEDDGLDVLFVHRWLLLCFKREFYDEQVLLMWEACWSQYQTDYFHLFLCVAMIQEYGQQVLHRNMQTDEMLHYFTDLSMKMDGNKVLRIARQLLLKFRKLPFIPCTLRGLLSGPGIWDSAPLPVIECHCHGNCYYGADLHPGIEDIGEENLSNEDLGKDRDSDEPSNETLANKEPSKESLSNKDLGNGSLSNDDLSNESLSNKSNEMEMGETEPSYGEKYEDEKPEKYISCKEEKETLEEASDTSEGEDIKESIEPEKNSEYCKSEQQQIVEEKAPISKTIICNENEEEIGPRSNTCTGHNDTAGSNELDDGKQIELGVTEVTTNNEPMENKSDENETGNGKEDVEEDESESKATELKSETCDFTGSRHESASVQDLIDRNRDQSKPDGSENNTKVSQESGEVDKITKEGVGEMCLGD